MMLHRADSEEYKNILKSYFQKELQRVRNDRSKYQDYDESSS